MAKEDHRNRNRSRPEHQQGRGARGFDARNEEEVWGGDYQEWPEWDRKDDWFLRGVPPGQRPRYGALRERDDERAYYDDREVPSYSAAPRKYDAQRPYAERYRRTGRELGAGERDLRYGDAFGTQRDQSYGQRDLYYEDYSDDWMRAGPHRGRGPEGYRRSNERILEDAHERLTRHGGLDAGKIELSVSEGEITLEGTVDSRRSKRMAEDALESISGVRDIHNRLRIAS